MGCEFFEIRGHLLSPLDAGGGLSATSAARQSGKSTWPGEKAGVLVLALPLGNIGWETEAGKRWANYLPL